jgi:hypothetical protein
VARTVGQFSASERADWTRAVEASQRVSDLRHIERNIGQRYLSGWRVSDSRQQVGNLLVLDRLVWSVYTIGVIAL